MTKAVLFKTLRFMAGFLLALFAAATLGTLFPRILGLGELGPVIISNFGPWVTIFTVAGTAVMVRACYQLRASRSFVWALLAAFAAVGSAFIQMQQVAVATAHGAHIDLVEALLAGPQADESLRPVTVPYGAYDGEELPLDIYRPTVLPGRGSAPVFVYIHGGGWGAQTLKQRQADYRWFAERGYLVISLEYPLSSETRHTWNIAEPQLACALAWVGANAARYGGDPARLALWGESAGGNLVLNLTYRANAGKLQTGCAGKVPHIAATIALYPVVDPARMYRNDNPLIGMFGRMMTINYTGGTPRQFPERYKAIASSSHISTAAPPTLLIVPEADHLVAPGAAYAFADAARAAGITTRLIRMPYAEHAFDLRSGSIGNQMVRQAMLQFLKAHELQP